MSRSIPCKIMTCLLALLLTAALSPANAAPLPQQGQNASPPSSQQKQPADSQSEPATANDQQPPNRPVGTAVAPAEKSSGVTASRPAGAVIAPAKQRRVRSIFIKIAVVAGAGAAIGAVALLSHSSPSQPH